MSGAPSGDTRTVWASVSVTSTDSGRGYLYAKDRTGPRMAAAGCDAGACHDDWHFGNYTRVDHFADIGKSGSRASGLWRHS